VLVVDDHEIVRRGLVQVISATPGFEVCAEASTVKEALKAVPETHAELALVDLSLGEEDGLELIKDFRVRFPDLRILVLSMHDETYYAERVLRAGGHGYVMKQEPTETLLSALRKVRDGEIAVSLKISDRILREVAGGRQGDSRSPVDTLSDRELQVFRLIGQGFSTNEMASRLHISVKTIETYRAHIKEKLKLPDSSRVLQHAIEWVKSEGG
jgi:DNA-binding NarL/FixJ family response regulator